MPRPLTPFEQRATDFFNVNKLYFFVAVCLIQFLLHYIEKEFVIDEIAAIKYMEGSQAFIFSLFQGIELLAVPFVLAWKFTVVAFVIWTGSFLWGYRITYTQCWHITMIASTLFFIPEVLTIGWFFFFHPDPTLWDVRAFYPFSLMNFFDHDFLDYRYWKPLKDLNIFEIIYWFVLVKGIDLVARKKKSVAYAIVFTSYVPLFLLWLLFYIGVYK